MTLNTALNSAERVLAEEIRHIIDRNQNERFLRKLLTRAIILEKLQSRGARARHG